MIGIVQNCSRLRSLVPALLVLTVACATRLPFPELTPFGHDEALEAARARPIWFGARPVESEVTSWWVPDPAGLLYVFALAEAFPRPAVARVELVALLNVGAVAVTYLLARRYFGDRAAFVGGLLYAANPWAATFSRQPWVITQPLLTALTLLSAMKVVVDRDRRWAVAFLLALAAQSQTHLLAVLYGPAVALTLLAFPRRWLGRESLVGLAGALILVAPYGLHLWGIRDTILEALARGNRGLTLAPEPDATRLTVWLISGYQLDAKLGFQAPLFEVLRAPLLVVGLAAAVLLGLGVAGAIGACIRREPGWQAHALVLIWFLAPLALMSWQRAAVYIHYMLVLLPAPFVLMGVGATIGGKRVVATSALVAAICSVWAVVIASFYLALHGMLTAPHTDVSPSAWQARLNEAELGAKQAGIGELHGLPLGYWQSVADLTKRHAHLASDNDVVVFTGIQDDANRHLDRRRKTIDYLLGPELGTRFPLEGLVVVPTSRDSLYLTIPEQDLPRVVARGATRLEEARLPGTDGATRLWLVRPRVAVELAQPRIGADAKSQTGVRLLGVDAPPRAAPGRIISLVTYWLVERDIAPIDEDDEPFVELRDGLGRELATRGAGGLPSAQWRAGDVLIQRSTLTVPFGLEIGEYRLAVGLASRVDGGRAAMVDGAGTPLGDAAVVATIAIRDDR